MLIDERKAMLRIIKINSVILVMASLLMLGGCATTAHFSSTPIAEPEFSKELADLKHRYADIEKYDRFFAGPASAPAKDELVQLWGEPVTRKKWGEFALGLGMSIGLVASGYVSFPVLAFVVLIDGAAMPREEYVWQKGDYEVIAHGRRGALTRYEKRIHNWKWEKKSRSTEVAQASPATQ